MKIFVTGCLHGSWDLLVDTLHEAEAHQQKIDLVIVSGDVQTMRTPDDLDSFACPPKYRTMGSFYRIYSGELRIPIPTIVIGGNHENMDWFHQMPFGGWLAQNVFYLGRAGSFVFGDTTFTSLSGIYQSPDYFRPVNERFPIRGSDMHSSYHIRAFSDFQLLGLSNTDIMITHDWPKNTAARYGGRYLEKRRPDLIKADKEGTFGLPSGPFLLHKLNPSAWFAAHHHITFNAKMGNCSFRALPKPTKGDWFSIIDFEGNPGELKYRGEWISILKATGQEMENPDILRSIDWNERWNSIRPMLTQCPDQPLGEFDVNPISYTINFCRKNSIFCPNQEIRSIMERNED